MCLFSRIKKLSLRTVMVVYVIVPLALSLFSAGYLALKLWEKKVESQMRNDLELVARAIQLPVSHAMERDRQRGVERALDSAFSLDTVYGAYAYDLEGQQIASSTREDDDDPEIRRLEEVLSEGKEVGEFGRVGKRRVYSYFVPLKDSRDQVSGLLQLTRRERDFRRYLGRMRLNVFVLLSSGIVLMSFLVLLGLHRVMGRHFALLLGGMRRVARGEAGYRFPMDGPSEIASIAMGVNQMLDSLQAGEQELRDNRRRQAVLEARLRHREKLAAIGQLAAGIAHELGTPLSTVSGTAQRQLRHVREDSKEGRALVRIRRETGRMENIIQRLLDFSHRQKPQHRKVLPAQAARSARDAVADYAARHGARLRLQGETDAPGFPADPIQIEQALVNLLRNAIQSAEGAEVTCAWEVREKWGVFRVDDDGPGIPESIRSRLFEPFFTTKPVGVGTGLGLSTVYGIVQEHGGEVQVEKNESGGARFELWFPVAGNGGSAQKAEESVAGAILDAQNTPGNFRGDGQGTVPFDRTTGRERRANETDRQAKSSRAAGGG